jgi:hypothetical protein
MARFSVEHDPEADVIMLAVGRHQLAIDRRIFAGAGIALAAYGVGFILGCAWERDRS